MARTLAEKLRLQPGQQITVMHRPDEKYFAEFTVCEDEPQAAVDVMVLFVNTLEQMKTEVLRFVERQILNSDGRLLIAYPKKGNSVTDTYIHRDDILPALGVSEEDGYIGDSDYKFNQMVSLDEVYTIVGVKRIKRGKVKQRVSQSVEDYVQYIPELERLLEQKPETLQFFQSLTPGYQRNWARYVYSAKQQATRDKRLQEMIGLLLQGVKVKK